MYQRNNTWMDGVPYVTQCPILPQQTFTYRFLAEPAGTHWYHSHFKNQRLDGLFGMLIVHRHSPLEPQLYATVNDWWAYDALDSDIFHPLSKDTPGAGDIMTNPELTPFSADNNLMSLLKFHSILINGRGRYQNGSGIPLTEFVLSPGERHRFRLVHSGSDSILEVSIDNHQMSVVSSDGYDINPVTVDSFFFHPGETIDFEVVGDQDPGKYWFRVRTMRYGIGPFPSPDNVTQEGKAILTYRGIQDSEDPESNERTCTEDQPCVTFNCIFEYRSAAHKRCVNIADARSTYTQADLDVEYGLKDTNVQEYFLNFGLPDGFPTINNRVDLGSRAPFYTDDFQNYITPCDEEECAEKPCRCSHIQTLPYNQTIQFVLYNYNPGEIILPHHNTHLHGNSFAVLALGFPSHNETTGFWSAYNPDIICEDDNPYYCVKPRWNGSRPPLNTESPPIKDTVVIPSRGYVVIRFRTTNPGPWLFHCHHEFHALDGMDMTLNVAPSRHPPPPSGLPTCTDFTWTSQKFREYLRGRQNPGNPGPAPNTTAIYPTDPPSPGPSNTGRYPGIRPVIMSYVHGHVNFFTIVCTCRCSQSRDTIIIHLDQKQIDSYIDNA